MTDRELLLSLLASLTFCDHMGDVADCVDRVMKQLGIEYEDTGEWELDVGRALHLLGVKTLYGTEIGGQDD